MRKSIVAATVMVSVCMMYGSALAAESGGGAIFKANCSSCHPNGGNVMNPNKALKGMNSSKMIITKVRSGGGGMPSFDAKTISDADAKRLADYIIKTFKK